MRSVRTNNFDHTISGLLTKPRDLFSEAKAIRERLAATKNDIDAMDRTLNLFGYEGDLDCHANRRSATLNSAGAN